MKKYIIGGLIVLLAGFVYLSFSRPISNHNTLGNSVPSNYSTTNSSSTCGTTVSTASAMNSALLYRSFTNVGTGTIYLWYSSTSTGLTAISGRPIFTSGTVEQSDVLGNLWTGTVFCITSAGTSTLSYVQW